MRLALPFIFCLLSLYAQAQFNTPRLEIYFTPGLFFENLSDDNLVPPDRRKGMRLGDNIQYGLQLAVPMKNYRFTLKAGAGFNNRHYSLNKYALINLDFSPGETADDSFYIKRVRFTNNYFQVPLSFSYIITPDRKKFKLAFGISLRSEFLLSRSTHVTFDSTYFIPQASDITAVKQLYMTNTNNFVFTVAAFTEGAFAFSKNTGLFFRVVPFSFYSSPLDKRLTTSSIDIISGTFGLFYSFK